jgi:hypothetical protein
MNENMVTQQETDFILSALNCYWNDASNNLQRKDLGDLERTMYEKQKSKSKELMDTLNLQSMQTMKRHSFHFFSGNQTERLRELFLKGEIKALGIGDDYEITIFYHGEGSERVLFVKNKSINSK